MNYYITVLALLILSLPAMARQTFTSGSYSSVTSVTITNATHGMGSKYFGVTARDGNGTALHPLVDFTWLINSSTYQVDISFVSSFSGTVKLVGVYANYSSNDRDFKLTSASSNQLTVCSGCGSFYAARAYSSKNLVMDEEATVTMWCGAHLWSDYVYVFLTDTGIVFQGGLEMGGTCSGGACGISITAYPYMTPGGTIATLGRAYLSCSTGFSGVTDMRPF